MGKPKGLFEAGAGSMAAAAVVGLIGALVSEAAGSIAGSRNRCVPEEADKPKAGFGVAESILKHATATPR